MKSSRSVENLRNWVVRNTLEKPIDKSGFFFTENYFSRAQVQRHNTVDDGWAIDEKTGSIYNITPLFNTSIMGHPHVSNGQMRASLETRLGGVKDISVDKAMHKGARTMSLWAAMRIGSLR